MPEQSNAAMPARPPQGKRAKAPPGSRQQSVMKESVREMKALTQLLEEEDAKLCELNSQRKALLDQLAV
ncbi:hypothetical protein ACHAPV_006826 [Trichoderma viride]